MGLGSSKSKHVQDFLPIVYHALFSPFIWLGIACLLGFFVVYMLLLTWADYSYVQPAAALAYGTIAVLSYLLLGEHVLWLRWSGIALICCGVLVAGRSHPNTTGIVP